MKLLFIKLSAFVAMTVTILFTMDHFYSLKAKGVFIEKTSYVISTTAKQFDYVAGGSSRVNNNFDPLIFDPITKLKGYNIGYSGSGLVENYLTLYLFLKNGNKAKNYLLQVEDNFLADPKKELTYPFHDYFFMPYIGDREVDEAYRTSVNPIKFYLWKYLPYIKYAEFNNHYKPVYFFTSSKPKAEFFDKNGYYPINVRHVPTFPAHSYKSIDAVVPPDPVNLTYLQKIKNLCDEQNIQFIIYSSPIFSPAYSAYKPKNLHEALTGFCKKNNILYYDFMLDANYSGDSLFYDETHLNDEGTNRFTKQLALTLNEKLKR